MTIRNKYLAFTAAALAIFGYSTNSQDQQNNEAMLTKFPVTHQVNYKNGKQAFFTKMPTAEIAGIVCDSDENIERFNKNHAGVDSMFYKVSQKGHIIHIRNGDGSIIDESGAYTKEAIDKTGDVKEIMTLKPQ